MAVLVILSGKHQGKRLALPEGEVIVGREATCQIRLATEEVSRQHCRLRCQGDDVFVTDLNSRNGTQINDVAIQSEMLLEPGDTLRIGPVSFQLVGKKTTADNPSKRQPSDDSILDWLAKGDDDESLTSDTTIIRGDSASKPGSSPHSKAAVTETSTLTPLPPTKKYKSVGEEGEAIIQRHYELIQDGKLPKRIPAVKGK